MTVADKVKVWLSRQDLTVSLGLLFAAMCIIATAVFGIIPNQGMLVANAFISGSVWAVCLMAIIIGGKRIHPVYYAACCMIVGGLTTSIPAIFYEHTTVDWGSTISRLGFALFVMRGLMDAFEKWQEREHGY